MIVTLIDKVAVR